MLRKNPVWNDVFVVKDLAARPSTANEAAFTFADVIDESLDAKKQHPAVGVQHRTVLSLAEHYSGALNLLSRTAME